MNVTYLKSLNSGIAPCVPMERFSAIIFFSTDQMFRWNIEKYVDEDVLQAKCISHHILDGVFNTGEVAEAYFVAEVEITVPQNA